MKRVALIMAGPNYLGVVEDTKIEKTKRAILDQTDLKEDELNFIVFDLNRLRLPQKTTVTSTAETLEELNGTK